MYDFGPDYACDTPEWIGYMLESVAKLLRLCGQDFVEIRWTGHEIVLVCPSGEPMEASEFKLGSATRGLIEMLSEWLVSVYAAPFVSKLEAEE